MAQSKGAVNISGLCLYFQRRYVKGLKFHQHGSYVSLGTPHLTHDLDEAYSPPRRPNGDLFVGCDTVVLEDFSKLLVIPLRDGCDLMDVIGRRLRAQAAE